MAGDYEVASESLESDHFRSLGDRRKGDPPLLPTKVSSCDTKLVVLEQEIDTEAMAISLPPVKLEQLNEPFELWPAKRATTIESEAWSLIGQLSHVSHIVRAVKFCIHRMLKAVGLAPQKQWKGRMATQRSM